MDVNRIVNDLFKIILNCLLVMMASVSVLNAFTSDCTAGEIGYQLLFALMCIATVFSRKYRYIGASIVLLLLFIAYLYH